MCDWYAGPAHELSPYAWLVPFRTGTNPDVWIRCRRKQGLWMRPQDYDTPVSSPDRASPY